MARSCDRESRVIIESKRYDAISPQERKRNPADRAPDTLLLQRGDPNPIKRHLSLYARRRLRRAILITKTPLPLISRKIAIKSLPEVPFKVDPKPAHRMLPKDFIIDAGPIIEMAHRVWRKHRDEMDRTGKYFLKFTQFMPAKEIREAVKAALQPNIIRLTADYLGGIPVLKDLNIWWTRPSARRTGAQNWHIDSIPDVRTLRFFVALTDIDEDNGPLTFLDADKSEDIVRDLGYLGGTIDASIIENRCGNFIERGIYKQGEAYCLDTARCLHCGSTNMKKDRLMLSISFSSYYVAEEIMDQSPWVVAPESLTGIEKMVLNLAH